MKKYHSLLYIIVLLLLVQTGFGQKKKAIPVFTADSLASGNYKDVLNSFFQLAFNNLTGDNRELRFTSNPYALMMRANPDLAVDTSYLKYNRLRNLNFNVSLKLDEDFGFNGFASGVNYAIINRRDYTVYKEFLDKVEITNKTYHVFTEELAVRIGAVRTTNPALAKKMQEQWTKLTNPDNRFTFDKLDPEVKKEFRQVAISNNLVDIVNIIDANESASVYSKTQQGYKRAKELFKNRLLWTVGISDTTYRDQFMFSNISIATQVLKGFSKENSIHGLEFDIRGAWNFVDDTLRLGKDLRRNLLRFEGGVNYILRSKKTDYSYLEFKASAEYRRLNSGKYVNEEQELFTLNGTVRVRVFDDIWIPLEFKYDPKNGNVLGFLSVRANFTALKNALR